MRRALVRRASHPPDRREIQRARDRGQPAVADRFLGRLARPLQDHGAIFESLAAEFEPHVRFARVDTDEQQQMAQYFNIQAIPTLSFIHRQREVARSIGALYHADLRRWIYGALSEPETSVGR